jgi:hypothetical protein
VVQGLYAVALLRKHLLLVLVLVQMLPPQLRVRMTREVEVEVSRATALL